MRRRRSSSRASPHTWHRTGAGSSTASRSSFLLELGFLLEAGEVLFGGLVEVAEGLDAEGGSHFGTRLQFTSGQLGGTSPDALERLDAATEGERFASFQLRAPPAQRQGLFVGVATTGRGKQFDRFPRRPRAGTGGTRVDETDRGARSSLVTSLSGSSRAAQETDTGMAASRQIRIFDEQSVECGAGFIVVQVPVRGYQPLDGDELANHPRVDNLADCQYLQLRLR